MPVPKCNQRAVNKYNKANYDRLAIMVPKGQKDILKAHAAEHGESLNAFVTRAIATMIAADKGYYRITETEKAKTAEAEKEVLAANETFWQM